MAQRKAYNPNTKYGRQKLRDQANYNYQNGTPEYRNEIDKMRSTANFVIVVIIIIIALIIYAVSGAEGLRRWAK